VGVCRGAGAPRRGSMGQALCCVPALVVVDPGVTAGLAVAVSSDTEQVLIDTAVLKFWFLGVRPQRGNKTGVGGLSHADADKLRLCVYPTSARPLAVRPDQFSTAGDPAYDPDLVS
jgi:hypothetical protein